MIALLLAFATDFQLLGQFLLAAGNSAGFWYCVPLVVVVSLVYGATRHEHLREILVHAFRSAVWLVTFMGAIFAMIWVAGYWN